MFNGKEYKILFAYFRRFSGTWKLVLILETPTKTKMGKSRDRGMFLR